ncbi:MAG: bifunctional diaminohydroxyphosphoribosylaminopyrimidine deaminase/5-amino-6-(5-phosphoribosylamino)uracil reductase RibD, partial [Leucobacter sp.]
MLQDDIVTDAMRRALSLARRGPAGNPNPQVGCVILDPEGRIVAEGWHRGAGSPHAEVDALTRVPEEWHRRAQELTAVVTLEPCNHVGHTGPCAIALRDFGIGSVVYSVDDPGGTVSDGTGPYGTESNVTSAGGAQTLRDAGVEVTGGVLVNEVRAFLRPWLTNVLRELGRPDGLDEAAGSPASRPRVIAKWAQTLDGRVAAANGTSQWITGTEARHDVHRRRAEADAILIGTGTLVVDNPALTARAPGGELLVSAAHQPIPIILGAREIP